MLVEVDGDTGRFRELSGVIESREDLERVAHAMGKTVRSISPFAKEQSTEGQRKYPVEDYFLLTTSNELRTVISITVGSYISILLENEGASTSVPSTGVADRA